MAYVEAIETENGCELERLYPERFARPEVMNQIAVLNQSGKASAERVIVLPGEEFDTLIGVVSPNRRNFRQAISHDIFRPDRIESTIAEAPSAKKAQGQIRGSPRAPCRKACLIRTRLASACKSLKPSLTEFSAVWAYNPLPIYSCRIALLKKTQNRNRIKLVQKTRPHGIAPR